MAVANITTHENPQFRLAIYNIEVLEADLLKRMKSDDSLFSGILTDLTQQLFGSMNNCEVRSDTMTHLCASGLTAKEVVNRIADIEDKELRKKLGASITSFIVSKSATELKKAFEIEFDFDQLDDTKGNINVQELTKKSEAGSRHLNVYYAKCLIHREGNKYDLNVAFYDFVSKIPVYDISALMQSKKDRTRDLEIAKAIAFNSLHRQLKAAWPDKIILEERTTLPSET